MRFRLMVATAVCKVERSLVAEGESGRSLGDDSVNLKLQDARLMNENRPSNLACNQPNQPTKDQLCTVRETSRL